jgi:hypothetical protein
MQIRADTRQDRSSSGQQARDGCRGCQVLCDWARFGRVPWRVEMNLPPVLERL